MDKIRTENDKLRTDSQATKEEQLSKLVAGKLQDGTSSYTPGQRKCVHFISSQYDV